MPCRRAHVRPPRGREAAYTIIELVVGMILLTLLVGLAGAVLLQGLGGSSGASARSVSDAAIARTMDMLQDDVAGASTEDRDANKLRDPMGLQLAVQRNRPGYSSNPADPATPLDLDEVVLARDNELRIRADVHVTPGYECITWRAVRRAELVIERLVDAGGGCGGGGIERREMLSVPLGARGLDTTPFRYELLCNKTECPGTPGGPACEPWTVDGSVPTARRRWIIGVGANLQALTQHGTGTGQRTATASSAIRGRDTETYRGALGC